MIVGLPLLLLVALSVQFGADCSLLSSYEFSRFVSDTKAELARSLFGKRLAKKDTAKVNVTLKKGPEIKISQTGQLGGLFRSSDENFILNGSRILQLRRRNPPDGSDGAYYVTTVNRLGIEEGALFFKQTDWKNIFFLVVCYREAYCQAHMSHSVSGTAFRQRIGTQTVPAAAEFFVDDDELFLIIVADPCKVYRWTGAYFDEYDELYTSGATGIAVLENEGSVIIVIAQNSWDRKVYSKVFVRRSKKIELVQLLETNQASDVLPYTLTTEGDVLHFVFILNNRKSSSVFWWNGREFSLWKSLDDVVGPGLLHADRVASELFFFFAHQNQLKVYHPTETSFDLVQVLMLDRNIMSIDFRKQPNLGPMLILLSDSARDSFLTITLITIDVNVLPVSDSQVGVTDPVLQCLSDLKNILDDREKKLRELTVLMDRFEESNRTTNSDHSISTQPHLKQFSTDHSRVNWPGMKLKAEPSEVERKLEDLNREAELLLRRTESISKKKIRYLVHGDVRILRMKAPRVYVKKFGSRAFDPSNVISVTKNQTLSGAIRLNTLRTNSLTLPSINGISPKDILLRNKPVQEIMGEHTVLSMKANDLIFGKLGKLNSTSYSDIGKFENVERTILGKKFFPRMKVKQLEVENINKVPAKDWLANIFPNYEALDQDDALNFKHLTVKNLNVAHINGMPWETFFHEKISQNRTTAGNSPLANIAKAKFLTAKTINNIPVSSFLTKDTSQNVLSTIEVASVKAPLLKPRHFNGNNPEAEWLPDRNGSDSQKTENVKTSEIIFGNLNTSRIIFKNPVNISGKIVDLNKLHDAYWMRSRPQKIEAFVTLEEMAINGELNVVRINNHTMDEFVRTDRPNTVTSHLVFETAKITGNVIVTPEARQNIDLHRLYESSVKTTGETRVEGRKTFLGTVEAKDLFADFINEANTPEVPFDASEPELKSKVSEKPEELGTMDVEEVEIAGNVTVRNGVNVTFLNGHHFDTVISRALKLDDPKLLERGIYSSLTVRTLDVDTINGIDFDSTMQNLRSNKKLRIIIDGDLEVPEINVITVNGIDFNKYMNKVVLKNDTIRTISGRKVFRQSVLVKGNLNGNLNGYNVSELQAFALSRSRRQSIVGAFTVEEFSGDNIDAEEIAGVSTEQILFQDNPTTQTIDSDVVFGSLTVVGDIKASNFMNGCDLEKATKISLEKVKRLKKLDVKGNLTWNRNVQDFKGISYLYANAMTKQDEQIVSGSITFESNVTFGKLSTKHHINEIDLEFIVQDALYYSLPLQEISQDITFKGTLKADNLLILNNVIVDNINGIEILDFDQRLVRNNADVEIMGKKEFVSGFKAFRMNADTINGAKTDEIIFYDDIEHNRTIKFPRSTFHSLKVVHDLNVLRVNNINLNDLLQQRLTKHGNQTISGNLSIDGMLIVKGNSQLPRINDVNTDETILTNGETSPRVVAGTIKFNNTLILPERAEVETINGRNITELYQRALLNDRDSFVEGSIVFAEDVIFNGNMEIRHRLNGCDTKKLRPLEIPRNIGHSEMTCGKAVQQEIDKMKNVSHLMIKPLVMADLEVKSVFSLGLMTLEKCVVSEYDDTMELNIYGKDYTRRCGLPNDCFCPMQTTILMSSATPNIVSVEKSFSRYYKYYDEELSVEVKVTTTTVSYNAKCQQNIHSAEESTTISWRRITKSQHEQPFVNATDLDEPISAGFINDVKFFKMGESVYIVMSFYTHPIESEQGWLNTTIYELKSSSGAITKADEISAQGAQTLEIFWSSKGVVLVIGNAYDTEIFNGSADSAIYRFNSFTNKFELLRIVKTHGISSIASLKYGKDSFIFFTQKQSWPFIILKYSHEFDNYYFSQKLDVSSWRVKANFLSAAAFATERKGYEGDAFVGIVLSDESFRLYKYKYIQGFVEELHRSQKNVKILQPFWLGSHQYLLAGSSGTSSKIYEIVQNGYMG